MTRRSAVLATAGFAVLAVAAPSAASAAAPGHWDPLTPSGGNNTDQVGLVRTPDTRLHVVWKRKNGTNNDLVQTVVEANGKLDAPSTIASNWIGIGAPAVVRSGNGQLTVIAGATQSLDPTSIASAAAWTSTDNGAHWNLQPAAVEREGGFSDFFAAAIGADGVTPFMANGATGALYVHRGTDQNVPASNFQGSWGCCAYFPGLALDSSSHQMIVTWYSNARGHLGVWAQTVDQSTGAPTGSPTQMPGSVTKYQGVPSTDEAVQSTPIVARPGGGVYVAYTSGYPSTTKMDVWKYGSHGATVVGTSARNRPEIKHIGITATPSGRLWAFWSAANRVYARRSNDKGTVWGAVTSVAGVKRGVELSEVQGDAQAGVLDVFGNFAQSPGGSQIYHTQIQPGLTLAAPARLPAAKKHAVFARLRVTDAGDAVKGVTVKLGSQTATTNGKGFATFRFGPEAKAGRLSASATRDGYVGATATVRVK